MSETSEAPISTEEVHKKFSVSSLPRKPLSRRAVKKVSEERKQQLNQTTTKLQETQVQLEETQKQAATDSLTGLGAKSLYEVTLAQEMANTDRERRSYLLELTVMDIDNFGFFNKQFGIPAGDEVLRSVGTNILSKLRESDRAFRIGGEELGVISRKTHNPAKTGNSSVSERLIQTIAEARSEHGFQVTVSAGQAEYIPGESKESFYKRANTAEIIAKFLGKNRAVIASVENGSDVFTDTSTKKKYHALHDADGKFLKTEELIV